MPQDIRLLVFWNPEQTRDASEIYEESGQNKLPQDCVLIAT